MAKAEFTINSLVGMVERGELRLPEMQREYVWRATRVRDLLDSLYRGYPSGVILAWESDEIVATTNFAIETSVTSAVRPLLLLDGQQRLTSLSAVLRGLPVSVKGRKKPIEILFNLDHPDEVSYVTDVYEDSEEDVEPDDVQDMDLQERFRRMTFVVSSSALKSHKNWVNVSDIFKLPDSDILKSSGLSGWDDPRYQRYADRLKAVRAIADYQYRMDILERTKSYEEVTEIFVRVNSLGAKLRGSDLALAQITARWRGSLEIFRAYQKEVNGLGFQLELGIFVRTLVSITTNQSKFAVINGIKLDQLQEGWERTRIAFTHALNYAKNNLDIDSQKLLSSPLLLITTAYWADKLNYQVSNEESQAFRRWFLSANAKGRYSRGSSESLLDQDLATLRDGGDAMALSQRLSQQFGRLAFSPEDLVGRNSRSGAFKTMFLAFRAAEARDWKTSLKIGANHAGKADAIEYHHLFPKAYLRREKPNLISGQVDDIANLAFIGSETNKIISDRAPSEYKTDFSAQVMGRQLVDFSHGLDAAEDFEQFITKRRAAIAARLNEFIGVSAD
jgi:hypothetical protein